MVVLDGKRKKSFKMKMTNMTRIVLGTTSRHKADTVRMACREIGLVAEVFGSMAESGQDAQPVGYDATRAGAASRAMQARSRDRSAIAVGIESGIVFENGIWNDVAIVAILVPPSLEPIVVESEPFAFPEECVREAEALGFGTTTVGAVIAKQFGCDPTDPHAFLSHGKVTRSDLLMKAVSEALRKVMKARE